MTTPIIARRILLPLDGGKLSISALPYLRAIAGPDTEITLLRVVPDATSLINRLPGQHAPAEDVLSRSIAACEAYLGDVCASLTDITPHVSTLTRTGHPADAILAVSDELGVDLILMATHGHGPVERMVLGSVADRIARTATMPVMLIRPYPIMRPLRANLEIHLQRIVVPIDGSEIAREALPKAIELATLLDAPIHLLRAISIEDHLDLDADALKQEYGALINAAELYRSTIADELEEEAALLREKGVDTTVEVLVGPAARSINEALTIGDLLVMTSHGEGGVRRWLVGSVAEKLMRQSVAPLVLVPSADRAPVAACQRDALATT